MTKAIASTLLAPGPSRVLGIVAVVFLATTTFVYIPSQIFLSNRDAFSAGALSLLAMSLAVIGGVSFIAWLVLSFVPERIARLLSAGLAVFAVSSFIVGSILTPLTVDSGLVDGGTQAIQIGSLLKVADLFTMAALFFFIINQFDRVQTFFVNGFIAGTALGLFYSAYAGAVGPGAGSVSLVGKGEAPSFNAAEFYELSSQENVFVILLDSFDAYFLDVLLEEDATLGKELEGFTFFPDTAAVSPTTTGALPTIHSGRMIPIESNLGATFEEMIGRESFLTQMAADAHVILLNPNRNLCPDLISCGNNNDLIMDGPDPLKSQWSVLSAISRFRVAPYIFKPALYNAERWYTVLSPQTADADVLPFFVKNMIVSDIRPQVRFLHLMHTHTPYNRDSDCNEIEPNNKSNRVAMNNARCAMRQVVSFLSALREYDLYDLSHILIFADHGAVSLDASKISPITASDIRVDRNGSFLSPDRTPRSKERYGAGLPQSSNPLFLFKPSNARGALGIDADRAVSLTDVPATICAHTTLCTSESGFNAFSAPTADVRTRVLYDYDMRSFQRTIGTGEQVAEVVDQIEFNFSLATPPAAHGFKSSERLKFNTAGYFAGLGFPERWGRWSYDDEVSFSLCFSERPKNGKILSFAARAYLPGPGSKQHVSIHVNDVLEMEETYRYKDTKLDDVLTWRINLDFDELDQENCAAIRFSLPDAVPAPITWREATSRRLAIGLIEMWLEEPDAERVK